MTFCFPLKNVWPWLFSPSTKPNDSTCRTIFNDNRHYRAISSRSQPTSPNIYRLPERRRIWCTRWESNPLPEVLEASAIRSASSAWSGVRESNSQHELGRLRYYHYTNPAYNLFNQRRLNRLTLFFRSFHCSSIFRWNFCCNVCEHLDWTPKLCKHVVD